MAREHDDEDASEAVQHRMRHHVGAAKNQKAHGIVGGVGQSVAQQEEQQLVAAAHVGGVQLKEEFLH